jgi:hypothetical protein
MGASFALLPAWWTGTPREQVLRAQGSTKFVQIVSILPVAGRTSQHG